LKGLRDNVQVEFHDKLDHKGILYCEAKRLCVDNIISQLPHGNHAAHSMMLSLTVKERRNILS